MEELFGAALERVRPSGLIGFHCQLDGDMLLVQGERYDLNQYERIFVLGSGKAAVPMAEALEQLLGERIYAGVVVSPSCEAMALQRITCMEADHPIPTEKSLEGANALIQMLRQCRKNDLFIYLLSGGSSALIEMPVEGVTLAEIQMTTDLMLKNALNISQINSIRKHLSAIKGGRLAEYTEASGIVLTLSDVIGDDLYSIGSAPLYADHSTYKEVIETLEVYGLFEQLPASVKKVLQEGIKGLRLETPKHPFDRVRHYLVGTNILARQAVMEKAFSLGLDAKVIEAPLQGDVHYAVEWMLDIARQSPQKVLIFGGEVTVKVNGSGQGGRNQHAVLYMLKQMKELGISMGFLSAGTDGIDGNSKAAGALIDSQSLQQQTKMQLNMDAYLEANDSNGFFRQLGGLIETGPTGTNVMDIAIIIKE